MTNLEIIYESAVHKKIFTQAQADAFLTATGDLPIHTFAEWRKMGYCVRKGEKAKLVCDIWRMTNYKKKETEDDTEEKKDHFYLKTAYFFTAEQVEKIEKA